MQLQLQAGNKILMRKSRHKAQPAVNDLPRTVFSEIYREYFTIKESQAHHSSEWAAEDHFFFEHRMSKMQPYIKPLAFGSCMLCKTNILLSLLSLAHSMPQERSYTV